MRVFDHWYAATSVKPIVSLLYLYCGKERTLFRSYESRFGFARGI